jgi:small subunit ribosomal protein S1
MSEETRIVEEQVEEETSAEVEVSQIQAETETTPDTVSAEAADVEVASAEDTASADTASAETVSTETASAEEAVSTETASAEEAVSAEETVDAEAVSAEAEAVAEDKAAADSDDESKQNVVYLSVGQEVPGTIKRVTEFGAFVDIGAGRDGLIHISELAVGRVNKVSDVVKEGQQVTAWIKKLDRNRNRISLTLIAPETRTIKDLQEGEVVPGKISKLMPYGAFVDIGVGTDALLHIREMSTGYVTKPEDVVKAGEELDVRIISVDRRRRRIDLSLKGLRDEPEVEQPQAPTVQEEAAAEVQAADTFAEVEVLSPMELAFKRAMEAEGVELNLKSGKKDKRSKKRTKAIQDEIISRTLQTMRD